MANFLPGFQSIGSVATIPMGEKELTYLAALKCASNAYNDSGARDLCKGRINIPSENIYEKEFKKRFYGYLGFLLCMFPTAGLWFRRGYFNDNNCMMAAYAIYLLSDSWFERMIMRIAMFNVWLMSWPWYNGFFSGLLYDACGKRFPTKKYMKKCFVYSCTSGSHPYSVKLYSKKLSPDKWPIPMGMRNMGEFMPDEDQETVSNINGKPQYLSTLGQLVSVLWSKNYD
jgi:hypothetical protein